MCMHWQGHSEVITSQSDFFSECSHKTWKECKEQLFKHCTSTATSRWGERVSTLNFLHIYWALWSLKAEDRCSLKCVKHIKISNAIASCLVAHRRRQSRWGSEIQRRKDLGEHPERVVRGPLCSFLCCSLRNRILINFKKLRTEFKGCRLATGWHT